MHYKMNYAAYETRIPDLHPYPPLNKSAASRSHLRKPENLSSRPRPFDPDDLTRRLYVVLAEQQAHAERKRRARAAAEAESEARRAAQARAQAQAQAQQDGNSTSTAVRESRPSAPVLKMQTEEPRETTRRKLSRHSLGASPKAGEAGSPKSYHHVPQVAASQFARTTTVEPLSDKILIHKLSKQALKTHVEELNTTTDRKRSDSLRRTQSLRDRQDEQDSFQNIQRLTSTTEVDENLVPPKVPRSPFREFLNTKIVEQDEKQMRRKSMGDMLHRIVAVFDPPSEMASQSPIEAQPTLSHCEVVFDAEEHRVDWTQSDETTNQPKPANLLRKTESKWALKTKLGSFRKHKGDIQTASPVEEKEKEKVSPIVTPKSPSKLGFLARFKR